jgi:hypothetical protein
MRCTSASRSSRVAGAGPWPSRPAHCSVRGSGSTDTAPTSGDTPASHHLSGQLGGLLQVVLGAGAGVAEDDFLGGSTGEHAGDSAVQITDGVGVAVGFWTVDGDPERVSPGNDGDFANAPRHTVSSAASLTRLRRSAPTMPGVVAVTASRSTSGASATPRTCTSRIYRRPAASAR